MKIVSFIPIKLNNRRLPGKNLMLLEGKPLCEYIFRTIGSITEIDKKYVYCSDEAILKYIPNELTFLKRDSRLDASDVKGTDIIASFMNDIKADVYVLTHVTQPFTKVDSIRSALKKVTSGEYDSAFSAVEIQDYCWYKGRPLNYDMDDLIITQNLEPVYMETGAFFIFNREVFEQTGRRIGKNPYMHIVDQFERTDIDTAEDFELAKAIARYLSDQ